jgi:hypothetical protein
LSKIAENCDHNIDYRIGFKISVLRSGKEVFRSSDAFEEVLTPGTSTPSWSPRSRLHEMYSKPKLAKPVLPKSGGYVRIRVDLYSVHPLSEVLLCPCGSPGTNGSLGSIRLFSM